MIKSPLRSLGSALAVGLLSLLPTTLLAQSATVEGTITESSSGAPAISDATVVISDSSSGQSWTGSTDGSGNYSIPVDVPAGGTRDVIVEAAGSDHAPARHGWTDPLPCFFGCAPGGEITLSDGGIETGIDISLEAGGKITGTVTAGDTGSGLSGATITLIDSASRRGYSAQFVPPTVGDGTYATDLALPPGDYHLIAEPAQELFGSGNYPNYVDNYVAEAWNDRSCEFTRCPIANTDTVTVSPGTVNGGIDFALEPGASISGTLEPDNIERLIFLFDGAGRYLEADYMLAPNLPETAWSFNGLAGGSYYVQFGPRTGQSPYLRALHNGLLCPWSGCERARGVPITIPARSTLGLATTTLAQGGQIEGSIVDAATGAAPTGVPTDADLGSYDIIDGSGTVVGGGRIYESGGDILLDTSSAVPAGDYYVRTFSEFFGDSIGFVAVGGREALEGYSDAVYPDVACAGIDCDLASASTVSVTAGNVTPGVVIEISTGSSISGRVIDASTSDPIEDAIVRVVDATGKILASNYTDATGEYQFGGFPAGTYYVRTSMSGHLGPGVGPVQLAYFDKVYGAPDNCSEQLCDPTSGTAVNLNGSTDVPLGDIAVSSGPIISGQILFALTGYVIPRGEVEVYTDAGELVGTYKLNGFDATYRTTALAAGDYTLVPVVSPAYADVSTSGGSAVRAAGQRGSNDNALVVTVGNDSVTADLRVVDRALDAIYNDDFQATQ